MRIHGRTKRQVEAMFQEEKPSLKSLPADTFAIFKEAVHSVQDDGTITADYVSYAARPAPIGSQVLVRVYEAEIVILDLETVSVMRRHPRSYKKGDLILPEEERIYNPSRQTYAILNEAKVIGTNTHALCVSLFEKDGRSGHKKMRGIVGLTRLHPEHRIESECARGLELGVRSYQTIKRMVEESAKLEIKTRLSDSNANLTQSHELIRDSQEYFNFWNDYKTVGDEDAANTALILEK